MGDDGSPAPRSRAHGLKRSTAPLVEGYDCAILDLDGVVYVGNEVVEAACEVLAKVRRGGTSVAFVTNNASRTPQSVAAHLMRLGVQAAPSDVVTSAQAAAREVAERVPPGARVLVIGGEGLLSAVHEVGLQPVGSSDDRPVAVVQGFGPDVGWKQLTEGAVAIRAGAIWVASNTDLTVPTDRGLAPGNGSFVNALAEAVGSRPAVVAGKPYRPLFDEVSRRTGSRTPLVVGDRLDTDIEGAANCGADSLLVMTGVTDVATFLTAPPMRRPAFVSWTLQGLLTAHDIPTNSGGGWRLGAWTGSVVGGSLHLNSLGPDPDPDDGLRLAATAAWEWCDEDRRDDLRLDDVVGMLGQLGLGHNKGAVHE